MSQKTAKRLRRMQAETDLLHDAYWRMLNRQAQTEARLEHLEGRISPWRRFCQKWKKRAQ